MKRRLLIAAAASALPLLCASLDATATQVEVHGEVASEGRVSVPEHARLSDAALAAHVHLDAYMAGASWLRPSLQVEQQRQKTGLLFDLDSLRRQARKDERDELAQLAQDLSTWLGRLPVTGRQTGLLDPRAVEVNAPENRPVADGDTLIYPHRPTTVRIVGAVARACTLPFVGLQDARRYLAGCKPSRYADPDWIYVIQPDGRVFERGVGLWNRSAPMPLAPGAVIYVPISERHVRRSAPDLNRELAAFLATQPLAEPEADR